MSQRTITLTITVSDYEAKLLAGVLRRVERDTIAAALRHDDGDSAFDAAALRRIREQIEGQR